MNAVLFDSTTGRILQLLVLPEEEGIARTAEAFHLQYLLVDELADNIGELFYVVDGALVPRPDLVGVTLNGLHLSGMPVGGTLRIGASVYQLTDSDVDLQFPLPGTYELRIEKFPSKAVDFVVTV